MPVHYPDNEMLKEAVWRDRQKISILVELTVCHKNVSYSERLRKCEWPTLKYRRIRGDMIETYKIITGII